MRERYAFTAADRAEFDAWIQRIPSGEAEEALFRALALRIKHDLAPVQMAVAGYELFLREAEAREIRIEESLAALLSLAELGARERTELAAGHVQLKAGQAEIRASIRRLTWRGALALLALLVLIAMEALFDPHLAPLLGVLAGP